MQLYLMQHGAAKSEAEDPQRGLTDDGRQSVERMARYLGALNLGVETIEHSEKLRTQQTAEILAAHLRPAHGTRKVAGLAPNDDVGPVCTRLQRLSASLIIVGHLPDLGRLVNRLLGVAEDWPVVRFQMGRVVYLDRDANNQWAIRWMLVPELLVV
jgi:phosphohistidine phosphatase